MSIRSGFLCFLLALAGLGLWEYAVNGPKAGRQVPGLVSEWGRIRTMEGSWGGRRHQMSKAGLASVGASFSSRAPCWDIFPYYGTELTRNGWRFDHTVRNPEGTSCVFRKGEYSAAVTCTDDGPLDRYWIDLQWRGPMSDARGLLAFLGLVAAICLVTFSAQRRISRHRAEPT